MKGGGGSRRPRTSAEIARRLVTEGLTLRQCVGAAGDCLDQAARPGEDAEALEATARIFTTAAYERVPRSGEDYRALLAVLAHDLRAGRFPPEPFLRRYWPGDRFERLARIISGA